MKLAKMTAIIDIGSNSISMVIYQKSSRFAFHLVEKCRSKVRIGENAYKNDGFLQEKPMQRAFNVLNEFLSIAKSFKCRKILCVATSAVRDAPNKNVFLKKVQKELKLSIKVIDGYKEGYYGAIAAINLLPPFNEATTIDIGGGSCEIAKIKNNKIVDVISLNLGTVRLKELFFDKKKSIEQIRSFIHKELDNIPKYFQSDTVIGIGGSIRALSLNIMKQQDYPLDSLHAFKYPVNKYIYYLDSIATYPILKLKKLGFSKNRIDTIREGSIIFSMAIQQLKANQIIVSKVGVREGVYLNDLLKTSNYLFPKNFNISIKSLVDRFAINEKNDNYLKKVATMLFDIFQKHFNLDQQYRSSLAYAAKVYNIIRRMNIYSKGNYDFYFLLENLNFVFSHQEKVLIAILAKYANKGKIDNKELKKYKTLLPNLHQLQWLCFLLSLANCINQNKSNQKLTITYQNNTLYINTTQESYLAKECIKKLTKPTPIAIIFNNIKD